MVRVYKCHSFASQCVIPVKKEPLAIYADGNRVFVATSDCEILVFQIQDGVSSQIHKCITISPVDQIVYNSYRNYIATVELKRSWRGNTRSVRVYLNWDSCGKDGTKPRTKVRIAGKSHVQHLSGLGDPSLLDIVEVPVDGKASCVTVCRLTGNFAVACGSEVKLCSVIEKTFGSSNKTYLDVEVFLELCWSFQVISISLCEEFVVCCSQKEVHGIQVSHSAASSGQLGKHHQGSRSSVSASPLSHSGSVGRLRGNSSDSPASQISETIQTNSPVFGRKESSLNKKYDIYTEDASIGKEFSNIGIVTSNRKSPRPTPDNDLDLSGTSIVDDDHFVEWKFDINGGSGRSVCLQGLHSSTTQTFCHQHTSLFSPPVLSCFSGGKSQPGGPIEASTVLYLSDPELREDWISVHLVPTHKGAPVTSLHPTPALMRSPLPRMSLCVYVSGSRGGYLYQLWPTLTLVSAYKYTDTASQIGLGHSQLYAVTTSGIETYTSRWGAVSLEEQHTEEGTHCPHPPSSLDTCLCGHEPFVGAVSLSVGDDMLALLSKVEDMSGKEETMWSLYILSCFSVQDQVKDMLAFAEKNRTLGPASYLHLLQEALLLLLSVEEEEEKAEEGMGVHYVLRLLGEYYSLPGQEDWWLCQPYYSRSRVGLQGVVDQALVKGDKMGPHEFGQGLLQYLDHVLFTMEGPLGACGEMDANISERLGDNILNIYAVAAPENLSKVILLSNLKTFRPEGALHHLRTWLSVKSSAGQPIGPIDGLALVQLHLSLCEVDLAWAEMELMSSGQLVSVCAGHPGLVCQGGTTLTPLAQLMRQYMTLTLLDVLVEMLDLGSLSLDSLILLLKTHEDEKIYLNNHIMEVLELIVSDESRGFLFQAATQLLCDIYITRLSSSSQQLMVKRAGQHNFKMPPITGHFAPRYGWLDCLPPFISPRHMTRPCQHLEVKHIAGQGLRAGGSRGVNVSMREGQEVCSCCVCNEALMKLQSLMCWSGVSVELATHVLNTLEVTGSSSGSTSGERHILSWHQSVQLLCQTRLDLPLATSTLVHMYPSMATNFGTCCLVKDIDKWAHLLRCMEQEMKVTQASGTQGETYVQAYKDLLYLLASMFSPVQFVHMLPDDGNLMFLLPFLCGNLKSSHAETLKQGIVGMGKELLYQN